VCVACLAACASSPYDRAWLSREVRGRVNVPLRPEGRATRALLPAGVSLTDGLSAGESVALGLWNNAVFQSELTQLGFARADLDDAGLLPNPVLSLLFPIGPRQIEAWMQWPIEVLWQRPRRVQAAQLDVERSARTLVQTGVDLARDVRVAHADAVLASERLRLRMEALPRWRSLAELTEARVRSGDLGPLESASARRDLALAEEQSLRARAEVVQARERLSLLVGVNLAPDVTLVSEDDTQDLPADVASLERVALASRPDVRAAELAVEAAGARAGFERSRIVSMSLRVDGFAFGQGSASTTEPTMRMGPQVALPIFNQNQGGVGRAEAEVERALWRAEAVRRQVAADVRQAHAQALAAQASLALWRGRAIPAAREAAEAARSAFARGEIAWQVVEDTALRENETTLREAELVAEQRRAAAQLTRALGGEVRHE
jgi:cobalt-zinc-cadmium efflux system outer membrane protein